MLIEKGADFFRKNDAGVTPSDIAAEKAKEMAFAMGQQERLGAGSSVCWLEIEIVTMMIEAV